ncbi:MAG TPA: hypothetical protein VGR28_09035 [Candidatus Thermoplasmatota archaeon]|jgi:hypothetical protein|nr:hypothetical protein [Candidatus Thermoplasmatota archaeon]
MKLKLALLTAAFLLPIASPVNAFHNATCDATGASPVTDLGGTGAFAFSTTLTPANGFGAAAGDEGNPIKFSMTLGAGEHYIVAAQVGDVDMVVCSPGAALNRHACSMGNVMPVPESCLLSIPGNPGSGTPIIGPGDFILYAYYCSGVACGYPADVPITAVAGVIL